MRVEAQHWRRDSHTLADIAHSRGGKSPPEQGRLLLSRRSPEIGHSPSCCCLSTGQAAGPCFPCSSGEGWLGSGASHQPHSARSCELASHAAGIVGVQPGLDGNLLSMRGVPVFRHTPFTGGSPDEQAVEMHYPWSIGAGCVGSGARQRLHSVCAFEVASRAPGVAGMRPGGECGSCLCEGCPR